MLLLSILFTTVSLLLCYALMRDTGRHTPHARRNQAPQKEAPPSRAIAVTKKETEVVGMS